MLSKLLERLRAKIGSLTHKLNIDSEVDEEPSRQLVAYRKEMMVNGQLLFAIDKLAQQENKTADEVANELLIFAIHERHAADAWLALWQGMSIREKQTASLICLGDTNQQIAEKMSISPNTVKSHVKNVLIHFKVNSKAELRDLLSDWDFTDWVNGSLKSQSQ